MRMIFLVTCFLGSILSLGHDTDTLWGKNGNSVTLTESNCSESVLVGKLINHKYLVEKRIGQGAFGTVYWANRSDGQNFAVKCMSEFYYTELSIMKELDHPNIIKLLDRLNDPISFTTYLVTQLCETDLHVAIFYPLKYDVRRIFLQILDAIIYMHQKGIYHRDLKPANILLTSVKNQGVKIADLGAASRKDLFDGNVVTTTEYAPPEIYDSKVPVKNAAIDAWSLGVILFNLVTRDIPWKEPPSEFKIIDTFQQKYGFSNQLTAFFRVVFTSSEKRPTVLEMKNIFSRIKTFMA